MADGWWRQLPNLLTVLRLVLAAAFFGAINLWWYDPPEEAVHLFDGHSGALWANIATVLFIVAAVTDAFDGWLARRWHVESVFGRIMDPVCDKVLILGAFVYLAGPRFVMPEKAAEGSLFAMASGVYPWMVVLIVFRELLVTGVRSVAEAAGVKFGSNWWGKAKMILQTIAIPVALVVAANFDLSDPRPFAENWNLWAVILRDILIWGTLVVTIGSAVPYISEFGRVMKGREKPGGGAEL